MASIRLAITALLALGACGQRAEPPANAVSSTAPVEVPTPHPAPPPPPFFVGRWAASEDMCASGAWVIGERELSTAGEVHCRFDQVSAVATGFEARAVCTAEGPPTFHRLRFAYAQSARALLIEGGPFADAGLIRCGAGEGG